MDNNINNFIINNTCHNLILNLKIFTLGYRKIIKEYVLQYMSICIKN